MAVLKVDASTYEEAIKEGKVAVKISSPTCGPCKMMVAPFEKLSEENPDVTFLAFEVSSPEDQELAKKLGVNSVPTFTVYSSGTRVHNFTGAHPLSVLKTKLGL